MEREAAGARMVGRQDAQVQAGRVTRAAGGAAAPGYQPEHKLTPTRRRGAPDRGLWPTIPTIGRQPSLRGRPNITQDQTGRGEA